MMEFPIQVAKFGGSSLSSMYSIENCCQILINNKEIGLVVVSACGNTTDILHEIYLQSSKKNFPKATALYQSLAEYHLNLALQLEIHPTSVETLKCLLDKLHELMELLISKKELSLKDQDEFTSYGEVLSSQLFSSVLEKRFQDDKSDMRKVKNFDAGQLIKTNDQFGQAAPLMEMTRQETLRALKNDLEAKTVVVTQGHLGSTLNGEITTLGRGGSDYTGAILAWALKAKTLQIWTDVSGIYTVDPKIHIKAKYIPEMSYQEAAELSQLGAQVLHPLTLVPCMESNIPIYIGNSQESHNNGTWIRHEAQDAPLIRAMALKKNQCLMTLSKIKLPHSPGYLATIFSLLAKYNISVDLITTSEISTSLTFHDNKSLPKALLNELNKMAKVEIQNDMDLVSIIGRKIIDTPGLPAKIFNTIYHYPIRFISMGSGPNNISLLVSKQHSKIIIKKLHERFLEEEYLMGNIHEVVIDLGGQQ